ncbi:hypothetical protein H0G86_000297 [Trichoderma simmonsii]|uniref:Aflatoxin regulatory protein domain-containing protein n=1 Tax=Trichoderma simmonsii TaxID=1491479 RepID=A0A8G0L4B7_9HYPO|nr:hypothetical protein H0G86_000297 [Trichoderma simmonsii]
MLDAQGAEIITASVTSALSHAVENMFTNCDGRYAPPHLSQDSISNGPFNNAMAARDYKSIFSAFEEDSGSMSAGLVDAGPEMDRLGFFPPSTASEGYQQPFSDVASLFVPIEDTTVFNPISESMSIPDTSSCSCCSSTGRLDSSSARFPSTGPSTASLADMSAGGTSPADIPKTLMCQCLDKALQLLKTVSGPSRTLSSSSSSSSVHSHYSSQPSQVVSRTPSTIPDGDESSVSFSAIETQSRWFQAALSENRQCLGAMENILACASTDGDSMLPLILCMILLKILDRYSNMAWSRTLLYHCRHRDIAELGSNMSGYFIMETGLVASSMHRPTIISNEQGQMQHIHLDRGESQHSDDQYLGRVTVHLVLGELQWYKPSNTPELRLGKQAANNSSADRGAWGSWSNIVFLREDFGAHDH